MKLMCWICHMFAVKQPCEIYIYICHIFAVKIAAFKKKQKKEAPLPSTADDKEATRRPPVLPGS